MKDSVIRNFGPPALIIIGGLVTAYGAWKASKEQAIVDSELKLANKSLVEAQQDLLESQQELLKFTTGGDSYGLIEVVKNFDGKKKYQGTFQFRNRGKYPLYDVKINIIDRRLHKTLFKQSDDNLQLQDLNKPYVYDLGNIPPSGSVLVSSPFKIENNKTQHFQFIINTINNTYDQELKFVRNDSSVYAATRLTLRSTFDSMPKILMDTADQKFPTAINGKIQWK